jgi:hypothetical protein
MKTTLQFLLLILCVQFFYVNDSSAQETICHKYNKINPTQEPASGPSCRVVGDTLYFEGAVTEDLFYELRDYHPNVKHLELNSYGGLVNAAYRISELVYDRKITTNVRKDARCASACTLIFQAGYRRSAHPSVRFLFHGARLSNLWVENWFEDRYEKGREQALEKLSIQFSEVEAETEHFFNQMIKYGMKPEFIEYYKSLPVSASWFPDGNFTRTKDLIISTPKLINYNIVQEFDFRSEFPE